MTEEVTGGSSPAPSGREPDETGANRQEQLSRLLSQLLELPEEERDAYLDAECPDDPDLRQELVELVAEDPDPSFLSPPKVVVARFREHLGALERGGAPQKPRTPATGEWSGRNVGRFQLGPMLGAGGMGVVYQALDLDLNRTVAVKLLSLHLRDVPEAAQRFQIEAKAQARLKHPTIVSIHQVGTTEDGTPYLVMAHVEGRTLQEVFAENADRSVSKRRGMEGDDKVAGQSAGSWWRVVATLVAELADALQVAHEAGIVHRDVKPSNVIVDEKGEPHLLDFGIARIQDEVSVTRTGHTPGTPNSMAPELFEDGAVGAQADIYSLGATLYQGLTARMPYAEHSPSRVREHVRKGPPPRPRRLEPKVPLDLETICVKAMDADPRTRYATAASLRDDLHRFLDRIYWFGAGFMWHLIGEHDKALPLLSTAARQPSAFLGDRTVLAHLIDTQLHLLEEQQAPHASIARNEARATVQRALRLPQADSKLVRFLHERSTVLEDPALELQVALRWAELAPDDPRPRAAALEAAQRLASEG